MRKEDARAVIRKYSLPSQEVSKRVLKALRTGALEQCTFLTAQQREDLALIAAVILPDRTTSGPKTSPANLPLYRFIRERYPAFVVRETSEQLQLECYFQGIKPNLLSLLLEFIPPDQVTSAACPSHRKPDGQQLPAPYRETFAQEGVSGITEATAAQLMDWIERGRSGEPLTLVSPICPDYAAERTETGGFRYTFNGLNGGIGIAGHRLCRSTPSLHSLFRDSFGLSKFVHLVCVADYEGFSEENVRRVRLTADQFHQKVIQSRDSFQNHPAGLFTARLFSDLCGGRTGWTAELEGMRARFATGEFSDELNSDLIQKISEERSSFYRRWFGNKKIPRQFLEALVVFQIAEYATAGKIIAEKCQNPLILSSGNGNLIRFCSLAKRVPALYLSSDT